MRETTKVDPMAYREFLGRVQIEKVRLDSLNLTRRDDPNEKGLVRIKCEPLEHSFDRGLLRVRFITAVRAESTDSEGKPITVFTLRARHTIEYTVSYSDVDESVLRLFVENNVMINLWPYIRELINNLSFRMDIPPIVLGLLMTIVPQQEDEGSR